MHICGMAEYCLTREYQRYSILEINNTKQIDSMIVVDG